jgi:hypothetical protein
MRFFKISTILKLCLIISILSFFISYNYAKTNGEKYNESIKNVKKVNNLR